MLRLKGKVMKARNRKTGEIVDIISYGGSTVRSDVLDYVSYIDSKGVEHSRASLNYYWDFETIETTNKEYDDIRAKALIEISKSVISSDIVIKELCRGSDIYTSKLIAGFASEVVDELMKQLKAN